MNCKISFKLKQNKQNWICYNKIEGIRIQLNLIRIRIARETFNFIV